jgi:hypothetical protein
MKMMKRTITVMIRMRKNKVKIVRIIIRIKKTLKFLTNHQKKNCSRRWKNSFQTIRNIQATHLSLILHNQNHQYNKNHQMKNNMYQNLNQYLTLVHSNPHSHPVLSIKNMSTPRRPSKKKWLKKCVKIEKDKKNRWTSNPLSNPPSPLSTLTKMTPLTSNLSTLTLNSLCITKTTITKVISRTTRWT